MSFRFNMLLRETGVPPNQMRLLRHNPVVAKRSLVDVWRSDCAFFEAYQSTQDAAKRSSFTRPWWAAFIGTWDGRTMFAGLYEAGAPSLIEAAFTAEISGETHEPGTVSRYPLSRSDLLAGYESRLFSDELRPVHLAARRLELAMVRSRPEKRACRCRPRPSSATRGASAARSRSSPRLTPPLPTATGDRARGRAPSAPRARGPQARTCSSSVHTGPPSQELEPPTNPGRFSPPPGPHSIGVNFLHRLTPVNLTEIVISPAGLRLHRPKLDADLYVPALLHGVFGSKHG